MQLSPATQAKVREKLGSLWRDRQCNVCQATTWTLSDRVFEVREFNQGAFVAGGAILPQIVMTCDTCGSTKLFNAIVLGVIDPKGCWF